MVGISFFTVPMNRPAYLVLTTTVLLVATVVPQPASAQGPPVVAPGVILPYEEVAYLDGVKFKIRVPVNWNGKLLLYMQGAKSAALPAEPMLVPYVTKDSQPPLESTLVSQGYALAASEVGTWDMQPKEELQDSHALLSYFRGKIGAPNRVIVWGNSLGGVTAAQMAEDYPRSGDGAIANCGPMAGWADRLDFSLDFAVAYSVALGWPESWGPVGDLRDGLAADFNKDVVPKVVLPNADNRGKWEFIRLVMGMPTESFWQGDPITGSPGMFLNVWATTAMREMLESAASGPVASNAGRDYALGPEDKTYLASLGVNADDLLAKMNARDRIHPDPRARDYIKRYGDLRGMPRRPLITLHNSLDCLADVRWERSYRDTVEASQSSGNLYQTYVKGIGHCAFTTRQLLFALTAMESWLDTGTKPDATFFPEADGFDNKFVPAPFPF